MNKDKGKGVMVASSSSPRNGDGECAENAAEPVLPAPRFFTPNDASKYDFVKVKVWLGDHADHYYVLSRFLLSRMLTVTKIPNHVALKIALELKKLLIDNTLFDVSQFDLEANLFKLMERQGYGKEYMNRYRMMTRFHHQRVPLVILVCGTACVGKSTIATQLAQRLNLPNVLQTDMVYELLRTSTDAPLASTPVWERDFRSDDELITEFCRECRIVRKGLAGDFRKAMKDGKPIIIEGIHLDPSMNNENKLQRNTPSKIDKPSSVPLTSVGNHAKQETDFITFLGRHKSRRGSLRNGNMEEGIYAGQVNELLNSLELMNMSGSVTEIKGKLLKDQEANKILPFRIKKFDVEPIIVPIVLKMAEFDHEALLEEWISSRGFRSKNLLKEKDKLMRNLKTIQNYLCSFKSQGLTVANISASAFPQTLDWLHNHLLQCIEKGISAASNGANGQTMHI